MIAKTTPSSSPDLPGDSTNQNFRLDPVGHAPDKGTDYYNSHLLAGSRTLPDSRKDNSRTEAWVASSNLRSSTKTYDATNHSTENLGSRGDTGR